MPCPVSEANVTLEPKTRASSPEHQLSDLTLGLACSVRNNSVVGHLGAAARGKRRPGVGMVICIRDDEMVRDLRMRLMTDCPAANRQ